MRLDHFLLSPNLADRLWTALLIDGRVGRKTRATTPQQGSCSISEADAPYARGETENRRM